MLDNVDIRRAYDRIAHDYADDPDAEDDPVMRAQWRRLFHERLPGKRVLEIGCGPGKDSKFFHDMGLDVTATDLSDTFVRIVRERYPYLTVHRMDMTEPDLPKESFDGIYGAASFIHLPREKAGHTLTALRDLLCPSGVLFLTLLKSTKVEEYVIDDWGGVENNPVLFTCYDEADIEVRAKKAGFRAVLFFYIESPVYKTLPRLVERGVSGYQIIATV